MKVQDLQRGTAEGGPGGVAAHQLAMWAFFPDRARSSVGRIFSDIIFLPLRQPVQKLNEVILCLCRLMQRMVPQNFAHHLNRNQLDELFGPATHDHPPGRALDNSKGGSPP
jgi:hypothetical protein